MYDRIKESCKKRGITVTELTVKTGIAQASMFRWDTNVPSVDKVAKVADALDVSIDYLLGRTEDSSNKTDIVEKMFQRPEMRTLFSMCENAPAEDIEYVIKKLERLKG